MSVPAQKTKVRFVKKGKKNIFLVVSSTSPKKNLSRESISEDLCDYFEALHKFIDMIYEEAASMGIT